MTIVATDVLLGDGLNERGESAEQQCPALCCLPCLPQSRWRASHCRSEALRREKSGERTGESRCIFIDVLGLNSDRQGAPDWGRSLAESGAVLLVNGQCLVYCVATDARRCLHPVNKLTTLRVT